MTIAIRYFTQTGNTKKMADAIAEHLGILAKPVTDDLDAKADILFICNSVYYIGIHKSVKEFIARNKANIGALVNVSSAALIESSYKKMKKIAKANAVNLLEMEYHCKGSFKSIHKGHPNDEDLKNLIAFVDEVLKEYKQ